MYDLIDQPVARLSLTARLVLWSMRSWIAAASEQRCPPAAVAPVLAGHGVLPALPHLHQLLSDINRGASRQIALAPPACQTVGDDEAVLLATLRNVTLAPPAARAAFEMLLEEKASESAFVAALTMTSIFHQAGLEEIGLATESAVRPQ